MTDVLDVCLGESSVGKLTLLTGDRLFFAFEEAYLNNPDHPVLSQSFSDWPFFECVAGVFFSLTKMAFSSRQCALPGPPSKETIDL
jgi:hypothetical protein